jgi:hypothetical protein
MIEILSVVGGSVVATLIAKYLWERQVQGRVRIRRIEHQNSTALQGLLELYGGLFSDEQRDYSSDDILSWLRDSDGRLKRKHTPCRDIVLAAEAGPHIVGFLFCHYYPSAKHAIVSYCGRDADSEVARTRDVMGLLLKRLFTILREEKPPCAGLLFEVDSRRLKTAFSVRAIRLGRRALELKIDYRRPRLSLEAEAEGDRLYLLFVPLGEVASGVVTRDTAVSLLESLHLLGYGDYYDPSDPRHFEYQQYLRRRVDEYRDRLPDPVRTS